MSQLLVIIFCIKSKGLYRWIQKAWHSDGASSSHLEHTRHYFDKAGMVQGEVCCLEFGFCPICCRRYIAEPASLRSSGSVSLQHPCFSSAQAQEGLQACDKQWKRHRTLSAQFKRPLAHAEAEIVVLQFRYEPISRLVCPLSRHTERPRESSLTPFRSCGFDVDARSTEVWDLLRKSVGLTEAR